MTYTCYIRKHNKLDKRDKLITDNIFGCCVALVNVFLLNIYLFF